MPAFQSELDYLRDALAQIRSYARNNNDSTVMRLGLIYDVANDALNEKPELSEQNRTLSDIIEAVRNGEKPTYDDLLYALLALSYLHTFDSQDMLKVYEKAPDDKPFGLKWIAEESFNRRKRAMDTPPKKYLGDSWDPANPEYQKQRKMMKKLVDKIIGDTED